MKVDTGQKLRPIKKLVVEYFCTWKYTYILIITGRHFPKKILICYFRNKKTDIFNVEFDDVVVDRLMGW